MHRDIRQQESEEATELILNLRDKFKINNTTVSSPRTPNLSIEQPKMPLDSKTVPEDLREIQPRPSRVWNCEEIGFDPNGSWLKFFLYLRVLHGETHVEIPNRRESPLLVYCSHLH